MPVSSWMYSESVSAAFSHDSMWLYLCVYGAGIDGRGIIGLCEGPHLNNSIDILINIQIEEKIGINKPINEDIPETRLNQISLSDCFNLFNSSRIARLSLV